MRVAMLAPISWRTPPRHYGPWELVASLITEGLVKTGIDVTLFATADSITKAKLAAVAPKGYSEDPSLDAKVWECLHISSLFDRADEFDVIHNHFDFLPLSYSGLVKTPMVTTIHGFSSDRILPVYRKYNGRTHYVSISNANRHPDLNYLATVHHGIAMGEFAQPDLHEDYLLFYGRIHPDKGAAEAIDVALRTNRRLILAGIVQDENYFNERIKPHLGNSGIEFIGPVGPERRSDLLGRAAALLHLINFDEPFGLSVVESMACGSPVIAVNRGSMPELIRHGETGFLVNSLDDAVSAVQASDKLERPRIRAHVQQNFSQEEMVRKYVIVYERILGMR